MPFTANRDFMESADCGEIDGMYLWDYKGEVIDGHQACFVRHLDMAAAKLLSISAMLTNDYTPHFQLSRRVFELAERVCRILPEISTMYFTNSGSESVKQPLRLFWYQRARGQAQRNRLISRERAYHGVNMAAFRWRA